MRGVVCVQFGAEPVVQRLEAPHPGEGQVLVRQAWSGIGAGDALMAAGRPWLFRPIFRAMMGPSRVLGRDVAGVVEAVGEGVGSVAVGDRVVGEAACAWAERVVVAESALALVPEGVSLRDAGTLPVSALTALQGLRAGGIRSGARVLVVGASGGVGHFAVQIAAVLGARVTGVCSGSKAEIVRELGAERTIDHRSGSFTEEHGAFDLVLDLAGHEPLGACLRTLAAGGVYVSSAGSNGGRWLGSLPRLLQAAVWGWFDRRVKVLTTAATPEDFRTLLGWVEQGRVRPRIEEEVAPGEVGVALERMRAGVGAGKRVIRFDTG